MSPREQQRPQQELPKSPEYVELEDTKGKYRVAVQQRDSAWRELRELRFKQRRSERESKIASDGGNNTSLETSWIQPDAVRGTQSSNPEVDEDEDEEEASGVATTVVRKAASRPASE